MLKITPEWETEVEIEISEDEDCNKPDPYDDVYKKMPKSTHMLKNR
jgi:hypothetical protein